MLPLACFAANAEWVVVTETEDKSLVMFADFQTFSRTGDVVKLWFLTDFAKATPNNILSSKALHEYRCKDKTFRVLSLTNYTGKLGGGGASNADTKFPDKWSYVTPGTIGEANMEAACSYKP